MTKAVITWISIDAFAVGAQIGVDGAFVGVHAIVVGVETLAFGTFASERSDRVRANPARAQACKKIAN